MTIYRQVNTGSLYSKKSEQRGVGLIESMVSLFVLAIGLLGMSSLQVNAVKHSQNAYYRTQATNLAYDMIDRMRANRNVAKTTNAYASNYNQTHTTSVDCNSSCTTSQIADYDLMTWKAEVKSLLPKGQAEISFSGTSNVRKVSVSIKFDESRGQTDTLEPLLIQAAL